MTLEFLYAIDFSIIVPLLFVLKGVCEEIVSDLKFAITCQSSTKPARQKSAIEKPNGPHYESHFSTIY